MAEVTIRTYLSRLRPVLAGWARQHDSLREITGDHVRQAIRAVAASTAADRHVALRSLFGALRQQRVLFRDPTTGIHLRAHGRPPRPLPSDQVGALLPVADDPMTRLIVALAVHALTAGQVRHLHIDDLDLPRGRLRLRHGTRRMLYLDELTLRLATEWMQQRQHRWPKTANPHLLVTTQTSADDQRPALSVPHLHRILRRLGVHATQLRMDRIFDEARATADPVQPHAPVRPVRNDGGEVRGDRSSRPHCSTPRVIMNARDDISRHRVAPE